MSSVVRLEQSEVSCFPSRVSLSLLVFFIILCNLSSVITNKDSKFNVSFSHHFIHHLNPHNIPLYEITKLCIKFFDFPLEQLIKILRFLCNVHKLKANTLLIAYTHQEVLQRNKTLLYVCQKK